MPNGYQFRLTLFWGVVGISVIVFEGVVYYSTVKNKQLIKHYSVINADWNVMKKFEKDANKLAEDGWRVQTVTETKHGRTWLGRQRAMALTVVYIRD